MIELDRKEILNLPTIIAMKYFKLFRVTMRHRSVVKPHLYAYLYGTKPTDDLTQDKIVNDVVEILKANQVRI